MKLQFDFHKVETTEFGVGRDDENGRAFSYVAVDERVQSALREMAEETWRQMCGSAETASRYEPSEKYGTAEYVYLPLEDQMSALLRDLHQSNNLPADSTVLSDPAKVSCYFVRLTDSKGQRMTGLRRATQFKGVLKNRLIRLVTDALKMIEDKVFKLDKDFDFLIDAERIHILHPAGFELVCQLQAAVLAAVPQNIKAIQKDLSFVDFSGVSDYASRHPRAARYLASIRAQEETKNVDKRALRKLCKRTGVDIRESGGKIIIEDGHVMAFLEVLDRRRYDIELVRESPERYRASSRQKLSNRGGNDL